MRVTAPKGLLVYELRRLIGRWAYLSALVLTVALTNLVWVDPSTGSSMLTVNQARVLYDSTVMAVTFASNLMIFIGLIGFYLVRRGVHEEWTSGMGSLLAALPVSNFSLLLGRWLAAAICLSTLSLTALLAVLAIHVFRVDTPVAPMIYVQTWFWITLPCLLFSSSMAVLCDSYAPLSGRLGDVLYFVIWMSSGFAMEVFWKTSWAAWNPLLLIDFPGHYSILVDLARLFGQTDIGVERSQFDAQLAPLTMPVGFLSLQMIGLRCASAGIALLPLWFGIRYFHRYSPDVFKVRRTGRFVVGYSLLHHLIRPLAIANGLSVPFTRLLRPALAGAARIPGVTGRIFADLLLTLMLNPVAIPVMLLCWMLSLIGDVNSLGDVLLACLIFWGILACDISARDQQTGWAKTGASYPGGLIESHWRKLSSGFLLGLSPCIFVLLRWCVACPGRALVLLSGLWACSALASLLGRRTGLPRPFLAVFLCGLWMSDNLSELPMLDSFGVHGSATVRLVGFQFLAGLCFCSDILLLRARSFRYL